MSNFITTTKFGWSVPLFYFFVNCVVFIGHLVDERGIGPDVLSAMICSIRLFMIRYSILQDSHCAILTWTSKPITEAKHIDKLTLTYKCIIVIRCSTFDELGGLYAWAHVHIKFNHFHFWPVQDEVRKRMYFIPNHEQD